MKCSRCGRRNNPGAITCRNCGAALIPAAPTKAADAAPVDNTSSAVPTENTSGAASSPVNLSKPRRRRRGWVWALIAALLLAACAYVIFFTGSKLGHYLPGTSSYTVLGDGILYRGKAVLDGVDVIKTDLSIDARTLGALDADGGLYLCRRGNTRRIDVNIKDFTVADGGGYMVYVDSASKLYAFNCKKKDAVPVCLCNDEAAENYAVSPEGKYVLFTRVSDGALYLCTVANGKESKLDRSLKPIALTDNAKYIYAYDQEDSSVYLLNKRGNAEYLRSGVGESIWFNFDHSEMVISSEAANGSVKTLVYHDGREYEAVNGAVAPVMSVSMLPHARIAEGFNVVTCPVKTFEGRLMGGDGLLSFSYEGCTGLGTTELENAVLSDDLKQLYYLSEGRLWRSASEDFTSAERISDDCAGFRCSKNGKALWFTDSNDSLFCVTASSTVRVHENVSEFAIAPNGREALFIAEGAVYYCRQSAPSKAKSLGVSALHAAVNSNGMYVYQDPAEGWQGITRSGKLYKLTEDEK